MGHWSARIKTTRKEVKNCKGAENEKQESEMEVDEATLQDASVQEEK